METCVICHEREADAECSAAFARPICKNCFVDRQVDMEIDINDEFADD